MLTLKKINWAASSLNKSTILNNYKMYVFPIPLNTSKFNEHSLFIIILATILNIPSSLLCLMSHTVNSATYHEIRKHAFPVYES